MKKLFKKLLKILAVISGSVFALFIAMIIYAQMTNLTPEEKAAKVIQDAEIAKAAKIAKAKRDKLSLIKKCDEDLLTIAKIAPSKYSWNGGHKEAADFLRSCVKLDKKKYKSILGSDIIRHDKLHKKAMIEKSKYNKEITAFTKLHGKKPAASAWDSSVVGVKRLLRQIANDPSSIDIESCSAVTYGDKRGWSTTCSFRGNNKFGGKVLSVKDFYISNGRVTMN